MPPFGDKLRKEREKRGITLDDVALNTKIGTRFLRALEEEHFDQLPGGIFNRGFVRAYARCVGLDEDQAIADYLVASGEAQAKKIEVAEPGQAPVPKVPTPKVEKPKEALAEKIERPDDNGEGSGLPWMLAAGIVVAVVLGLVIWHFVSGRSAEVGNAPSNAPSTAAMASTPAPSSPSEAAGGQAASAVPAAGPGSSTSPASFVVLVKASEDAWVSITVDGKPFLEDTLEPSAEKSVEGHSEIAVRTGNLGGLEFWFNGKKLPSQGDEGEVKTLTFDTNGLRPAAPKPQPAATPSP